MQQLKYQLFSAYYQARKNKRNTHNQLNFEIDYEQNLWNLYREIETGTYQIGKSIAFIIQNKVKREVFAADFRDRIVHHLLYNYINPILDVQFINNSFSCRKGKGTFGGIQTAYEQLKVLSNHFTKDVYILKQ